MPQSNAKEPITLAIDTLSYGVYGIGRREGKAVMVPNTVPGDKVLARTVEKKERYEIGELVQMVDPSPERQEAPCPYVPQCGGCAWQHIRYVAQLKAKQQSVDDALRRIGKLSGFEMRPIIASPQEYSYRRRIRLQMSANRDVGFHRSGSHDIVSIESCLIADPRINAAVPPLRAWLKEIRFPVEYVELVTGDEPNQLVAVAKIGGRISAEDHPVCENLLTDPSPLNGLILQNREWRKGWGRTRISISLPDELSLSVEANVFTQVNPDANRRLIRELLSVATFTSRDRVLELYCGAGNFTLPIAKRVADVLAVEGSAESIASGKYSAELNNLENIRWLHAPVSKAVRQLKRDRGQYSKLVLDPPRTGARDIQDDLASLSIDKIFYVSCNPATLSRDIAALAQHGYKLTLVQPIDLFPHTFHVETLALAERS